MAYGGPSDSEIWTFIVVVLGVVALLGFGVGWLVFG